MDQGGKEAFGTCLLIYGGDQNICSGHYFLLVVPHQRPSHQPFGLISVPIGKGCSARPTEFQVNDEYATAIYVYFEARSDDVVGVIVSAHQDRVNDCAPLPSQLTRKRSDSSSNLAGSTAKMAKITASAQTAHNAGNIQGLWDAFLQLQALADTDDEQVEAAQQKVTHLQQQLDAQTEVQAAEKKKFNKKLSKALKLATIAQEKTSAAESKVRALQKEVAKSKSKAPSTPLASDTARQATFYAAHAAHVEDLKASTNQILAQQEQNNAFALRALHYTTSVLKGTPPVTLEQKLSKWKGMVDQELISQELFAELQRKEVDEFLNADKSDNVTTK